MMRFFRRRPPTIPFDLAAIGDHWQHVPVPDTALPERFALRRLPEGFDRGAYPFVALVQPVAVVLPDQFGPWTTAVHFALEREATALLALVHEGPRQVTWYAYAGTREALDAALKFLAATKPVRWAVNEDRDWNEYVHVRALAPEAGATTSATGAFAASAADAGDTTPPRPATATVPPPPAPEILRGSPIDTPLGFLTGRHRIRLDGVHQDPAAGTLQFAGEIGAGGEWFEFEMQFVGVAAVAVEEAEGSPWSSICHLNDALDSTWSAIHGPEGPMRRHVIVQTDDDLFHVACADLKTTVGKRRPRGADE